MSSGPEDLSLFDLFRMEAEEQVGVLQGELIHVESGEATAASLESLMRAAHSLKGAARIIGLDVIVQLTHAMEDRFVKAQEGVALDSADIDRMLQSTDWLAQLQAVAETETAAWLEANTPAIAAFAATFANDATQAAGSVEQAPKPDAAEAAPPSKSSRTRRKASNAKDATPPGKPPSAAISAPAPQSAPHTADKNPAPVPAESNETMLTQISSQDRAASERSVRISAERFDQILSLASETLVASRKLVMQSDLFERNQRAVAQFVHVMEDNSATDTARSAAQKEIARQTSILAAGITELDFHLRANERTAERLYRTVLSGRLRPFSEGIVSIARLVRDTSRDLGKSVRLEVLGDRTRVDRDILERLEAPLSHLITNAIDHGIETPAERAAAGKPAEAHLSLHARHENGRLVITISDDGRGIHRDQLRNRIIARNFVTHETAACLSDNELFEFLFLPGFSTKESVSTISGRGVGLNVVQSMVQEAGGSVTVSSEPGAGTTFRIALPITRSVIKAIRLQVEGEFFAVPLVRIDRVAFLEATANSQASADSAPTHTTEFNGKVLTVVSLGSLLGLSTRPLPGGTIPMLISGGIAFAVDRLVDEIELSVRRLDRRLGKIPGVSASSLDENGLPLLILDMEDLIQVVQGRSNTVESASSASAAPRVLVVDDSHTVREIERRILVRAGYSVTTAQNGQEAWNLLRLSDYDLLVSDVDMPQMNGIELVLKVREHPHFGRMPVIILSYKDREEDRRRGLEAGADFYLTKGDFQNDVFRQAVEDLIGTAEPTPGMSNTAGRDNDADSGGAI